MTVKLTAQGGGVGSVVIVLAGRKVVSTFTGAVTGAVKGAIDGSDLTSEPTGKPFSYLHAVFLAF